MCRRLPIRTDLPQGGMVGFQMSAQAGTEEFGGGIPNLGSRAQACWVARHWTSKARPDMYLHPIKNDLDRPSSKSARENNSLGEGKREVRTTRRRHVTIKRHCCHPARLPNPPPMKAEEGHHGLTGRCLACLKRGLRQGARRQRLLRIGGSRSPTRRLGRLLTNPPSPVHRFRVQPRLPQVDR